MEFLDAPRRRQLDIPAWALALLVAAYALPGNLGHSAWRGDDALHIGIAYEMLQDGSWLVPTVAGIPWADGTPLLHWLGALCGLVLGLVLPLADAIRFATVGALVLMLWALQSCARHLFDRESAMAALLLSIGSIGLVVHAHEAQPMIAVLAMQTVALLGFTRERQLPRFGAMLAALGTAGSFLAGGLPGLALTLPLWLLPADGDQAPRQRPLALLVLAALLLIWPVLLGIFAPEHLARWWQATLANTVPGAHQWDRFGALTGQLGWFTWPLWPVAGWALWRRRRALSASPLFLPLASLVLALLVVILTGPLRPANALPLLPPLILIAAAEVPHLRRGASNFFDWFGIMSFTLLGLFVWIAWSALHFGQPAPLARSIARLTTYTPEFSWPLALLAVLLSVGWLLALVRLPRFALRGALHWALGITLLWGLAASLWLPWIDHTKSYEKISRTLAGHALQHAAPGSCIASRGPGDNQRAALYFEAGLRLDPAADAAERCKLMITHATGRSAEPAAGSDWLVVWSTQRGRGRQAESLTLWRRAPAEPAAPATSTN